jgi:NADH-quinone oxidoreductase E subunit
MLSDASRIEIGRTREEYPDVKSALLPALYLAQRDYGGWLPDEALEAVATEMELPVAYVAATASFYTMFHRQPVGRHVVQVCTNISCSLLGGDHLLNHIGRKLGIEPGETTANGNFTLLEVECLGSCGTAPMMQVNDGYYENLTEERVDQILSELSEREVAL